MSILTYKRTEEHAACPPDFSREIVLFSQDWLLAPFTVSGVCSTDVPPPARFTLITHRCHRLPILPLFYVSPATLLCPSFSVSKNIDVDFPLSVNRETPDSVKRAGEILSRETVSFPPRLVSSFLIKLATRPETAREKKSHHWDNLTEKQSTLIRNATRCFDAETFAGGRDAHHHYK